MVNYRVSSSESGYLHHHEERKKVKCKGIKKKKVQPVFQSLHWLPVTHHIRYKISTICFSSLSGKSPQYLSDTVQPYTLTRKLHSASDTHTFVIPCVNQNYLAKDHSLNPSVWNKLPQSVRHSDSSSSFKTALKTHLFQSGF